MMRRAGTIGIVLLLLAALSIWQVQNLKINYNQLDLLPQNLPSVKATNEMISLAGGVGYLIIALKSRDVNHMKAVADDLVELVAKVPGIQDASCKLDMEFIKNHLPYYIKTEDLEEVYKRVRKYIRSQIRKENPFNLGIGAAEEKPLDFSDLIEKYRSIDKRGIDDPYFLDASREMILIIAQPKGNPGDIEFSEKLIANIDKTITEYNADNPHRAVLKEHYRDLAQDATVTYGYTGDYKNNIDDARVVSKALAPTSIVAFSGILFLLIILMRRIRQIALMLITLVVSVVMTYAFCQVAIGELNTITVILGAILMGFGIDFGIYFTYRMREEYMRTRDFAESLRETLMHAGSASAISAFISASSFLILMISDFKGFSQFGLMAGMGVLITALMMFVALPVMYILIDRVWPSFKEDLIVYDIRAKSSDEYTRPFPYAKRILTVSLILTGFLVFFATRITFDYDGRSFMTADSPAVILQEEVTRRFKISSDPAAIYARNLEEARDLYERLAPAEGKNTIDSVLSVYSLVPDADQQKANREVLDKIQEKLSMIPDSLLDEKDQGELHMVRQYLKTRPFAMKDVPAHLIRQFRPSAATGDPGYLTYIYPKISVWDGRELIRFADEIGTLNIKGKEYHAAGMAVLFADLARIVLRDGKRFILFAALIIVGILLVAFRSPRAVLLAMLPLVAGMFWMLGLMSIFGWKINFVNIVVFPVVLGYGISLGVYIDKRYMESGSVMTAVKRTGAAIAGSSITTLIGWAALLVSGHRGLESMGILAFFGISAALVITFTVLPALLQIAADRKLIELDEPEEGGDIQP